MPPKSKHGGLTWANARWITRRLAVVRRIPAGTVVVTRERATRALTQRTDARRRAEDAVSAGGENGNALPPTVPTRAPNKHRDPPRARALPEGSRGISLARKRARTRGLPAALARFRLLRAKQPLRQFVSGLINRRATGVGPPLSPSRRGLAGLLRIYATSSRGRDGEIVIARRFRRGFVAKSTAGRGSSKTTIARVADIRRNNRISRYKGVWEQRCRGRRAARASDKNIHDGSARGTDRKSFTRANDYSVTEITSSLFFFFHENVLFTLRSRWK